MGSFIKHAREKSKFFKIFNVRVTLSTFPKGQDKHDKENKLRNLLSKTQKELPGLVSITINSPIKTTLTQNNIQKIEGQRELVTYSLLVGKGVLRARLHLNRTNCTSHYNAKDFKHFLESPEEEKLRHNSSLQMEPPKIFPEKKEEEASQQDDLLNMFLEKDDSISDIEIEDEGVKTYYAVAAGRKTGVFTSWSAAQDVTNGYSGVCMKSFDTRK